MQRLLTVMAMAMLAVACGHRDDDEEDEDCAVEVVDGIVVDERTCEPPELVNFDCRNDDDCDAGTVCYFSSAACMDDDETTVCDDMGKCADPDTAHYCASDDDCDGGACITDDRFCVKDRRDNPLPGCAGWCSRSCIGGDANGVDPETGICWEMLSDCSSPPGFLPPREGQVCRPL